MQNYRGQLHNLQTSTREDGTAVGLTALAMWKIFWLTVLVRDSKNIGKELTVSILNEVRYNSMWWTLNVSNLLHNVALFSSSFVYPILFWNQQKKIEPFYFLPLRQQCSEGLLYPAGGIEIFMYQHKDLSHVLLCERVLMSLRTL